MPGQKFTIKPQGAVKSGSAAYTVDALGDLQFQAIIKVGFWPVYTTQMYPADGGWAPYKVDPASLKSSIFSKVGDALTMPPPPEPPKVVFTAQDVEPGTVKVGITLPGQTMVTSAQGTLDTSNPVLTIKQLVAQVKVSVFNLTIEADEVIPGYYRAPSTKSEFQRLREFAKELRTALWSRLCNL